MARREFSVREIAEVLTHWDAGRGIRQIARSLGMDRNTVRKYIRMAEGAGFEPGQGRSLAAWTLLVHRALPALADPVRQSAKFGLLDGYREEIREGLRTNHVATVWQRLVAFFQRTPQWCLTQAALLGPAVRQTVEEVLAVRTLYNLRQAQGILRQADRYGAQRLDAACARALAFGDPCYRTIKQILERGLDGHPVPQTLNGEAASHALLHGPDAFALKPEKGRQP